MNRIEAKQIKESLMLANVDKAEIDSILYKLQNKNPQIKEKPKKFNKVLYWTALFITIFGNFFVIAVLIPFLLIARGIQLYSVILIFAFFMGYVFEILLRDLEEIDYKHRVIAWLFLPAVAIINIFIITNIASKIQQIIQIHPFKENPFTISAIYIISFLIPYGLFELYDKLK